MPVLLLFLMILAFAQSSFAQGEGAPETVPASMVEPSPSWQKVQDFEDTLFFTTVGPPTEKYAARAREETQLYEDMVANIDDVEDETDSNDNEDFLFVVGVFFDSNDSSRPASFQDDDVLNDMMARWDTLSANSTTSVYVDSIRPTFFPGAQLKPRVVDLKKQQTQARSLFADPELPNVEKLPETPAEPSQPVSVPSAENTKQKVMPPFRGANEKAGAINAPPKQKASSPDEETLHELKRAVKELGLEKQFDLGTREDGRQVMQHAQDTPLAEHSAEKNEPPLPTADAGKRKSKSASNPVKKPIVKKSAIKKKKQKLKKRRVVEPSPIRDLL